MAARVLAPALLREKHLFQKISRLAYDFENCPIFDLEKECDVEVEENFKLIDGDCAWAPSMCINSQDIFRARIN